MSINIGQNPLFVNIYGLKNPMSEEIFYIGKSKDLKQRLKQHISDSKKKTLKSNLYINKLLSQGVMPELITIDQVPICNWEYWEQYYIKLLLPFSTASQNISDGGSNSYKLHSKVVQYDKEGNYLEMFESVEIAAIKTNIDAHRIYQSCTVGRMNKCGYYWRYLTDSNKGTYMDRIERKKNNQLTPVYQVTWEGEIINEFKSIMDASRSTGVCDNSINNHCRGKFIGKKLNGHSLKFTFRFKND